MMSPSKINMRRGGTFEVRPKYCSFVRVVGEIEGGHRKKIGMSMSKMSLFQNILRSSRQFFDFW